jgi:RNA polymerase sigma-70 factor (ECF subfamily)
MRLDRPVTSATVTVPNRCTIWSSAPGTGANQQSLYQLSPAHAEVIDLVYYHGKSIKEVAEIVGMPDATVKTRMFYARKKLGGLLRDPIRSTRVF